MANTINHSWVETRRGRKTIVTNKTINGSENPWIGSLIGSFRSDATDEFDDAFYAMAYLIEEYGDNAIEEVGEMSKQERREYVGDIEDRLYEQRQPSRTGQNVLMNGGSGQDG